MPNPFNPYGVRGIGPAANPINEALINVESETKVLMERIEYEMNCRKPTFVCNPNLANTWNNLLNVSYMLQNLSQGLLLSQQSYAPSVEPMLNYPQPAMYARNEGYPQYGPITYLIPDMAHSGHNLM